jgi:hypothetical protein
MSKEVHHPTPGNWSPTIFIGFLTKLPLVFGTWKPTTLQSRCQNRCQIQLHEFLSNLKKCPQTCPKRRVCIYLPIDYSFLKLVPKASSASFTFWWWLL